MSSPENPAGEHCSLKPYVPCCFLILIMLAIGVETEQALANPYIAECELLSIHACSKLIYIINAQGHRRPTG